MTQLQRPTSSASPRRAAPPAGALSWLEIDLSRLRHNVGTLRVAAGEGVAVCAAVKKDAYGLGAAAVAPALVEAGCAALGVFSVAEAAELAGLGLPAAVHVFMPVDYLDRSSPLYRLAAAGRLHFYIHSLDQLHRLGECARQLGLTLPVHLFADTGMARAGLTPAQVGQAAAQAAKLRHLKLAGLASHLATADSDPQFAEVQRQRFAQLLETLAPQHPSLTAHLANSYGTLRWAGRENLWGNSFRGMVRPGVALSAGYGVDDLVDPPAALRERQLQLRPPMSWWSWVYHLERYAAGTPVGYGSTWTAPRDATIAVVPAGYADGYRVAWSNRSVVRLFDNQRNLLGTAPVAGRVNMDQITIDVTDLAAVHGDAALRAAQVELISHDPTAANALGTLAKLASTHVYEVQCGLSPRLPRVYR